ncbi:MAG TPA: methylenetetrahydrofolate--tRNA-(uracil(54)-C(5))-methyltransferase (FADH(2)-oxidizing) TrmFO, partial [Candidatus Sulfobium mesophilum]|nr:methylenetetrahydrofolate--tRNA-(uracil(54)-C(5))-methyltransferase (FADH(2)-oxidizing) TrmFO [Candidatus Sulfobium mesophilum]
GINAAFMMKGKDTVDVPSTTSHGALIWHITESEPGSFQPSNINFGLFPVSEALMKIRDKKKRKAAIVDRALMDWGEYVKKVAQ